MPPAVFGISTWGVRIPLAPQAEIRSDQHRGGFFISRPGRIHPPTPSRIATGTTKRVPSEGPPRAAEGVGAARGRSVRIHPAEGSATIDESDST